MNRLLFFVLVGLGGAAVLIWLGTWQVQRLGWKEAILADIETRIAAAPVALPETPDPKADSFLPVTATGTTGSEYIRILTSQKRLGAGYRIISAFEADGRRVLIDAGFIPTGEILQWAPIQTAVTGNLHWPQEIDSFTPAADTAANIWFARDVPALANALGTDPILIVARQMSPANSTVTPLPVDTAHIPNDHLQYAITWFSLAAIWLAMTTYFLMRSKRS